MRARATRVASACVHTRLGNGRGWAVYVQMSMTAKNRRTTPNPRLSSRCARWNPAASRGSPDREPLDRSDRPLVTLTPTPRSSGDGHLDAAMTGWPRLLDVFAATAENARFFLLFALLPGVLLLARRLFVTR